MKYATPQAFERALSDRLKRQAAEAGADLDRLRKRVAFERFLARLFDQNPTPWVLKGGYALELRLGGRARATRDVDLDRPPRPDPIHRPLLSPFFAAFSLDGEDVDVLPTILPGVGICPLSAGHGLAASVLDGRKRAAGTVGAEADEREA